MKDTDLTAAYANAAQTAGISYAMQHALRLRTVADKVAAERQEAIAKKWDASAERHQLEGARYHQEGDHDSGDEHDVWASEDKNTAACIRAFKEQP